MVRGLYHCYTIGLTVLLQNKKIRLNYEILDTYTVGVTLSGGEVKSLRSKQGSLDGSYISTKTNSNGRTELWVRNFSIPAYQIKNSPTGYDPERMRKLLLNRKEITTIEQSLKTARLTMVPLSVHAMGPKIKVKIALVRGKKKYDNNGIPPPAI